MASIFDGCTLRDVSLRNRIGVSPMCEYSCEDTIGPVRAGILRLTPALARGEHQAYRLNRAASALKTRCSSVGGS